MTAARATFATIERAPPAAAGGVRALAFAGCLGQLHLAAGDTGVLMCSPWGYEELCARRSWRRLAESIADAGAPCLRFDYPGTGDSGDPTTLDLEAWVTATLGAAARLREVTGVRRLILLGQGLGAAVASLAAARLRGVEGLVLMAPAAVGRQHLRELAMWGAVVSASIRLPASVGEDVGVAGFVLAPALAAGLKGVDLLVAPPKAAETLVVGRPGNAQDSRLAAAIEAAGGRVDWLDYDGYDTLLTDPTMAQTPEAVIAGVAGWVGRRTARRPDASVAAPAAAVEIAGAGFVETPVRFGGAAQLFGVLCRPHGARRGRTVVMLNSGHDPHTGWARAWVEQARALAADGIASLRIDAAGIGDSPAGPGAPDQTLYSDTQVGDARAAVDWLETQGLGPVILAGRCSGAYLGLDAAVADPRVAGLVMVNPLRLVWRPGESVDEAIRSASLAHYRARILQPETIGRIMRGEVAVGRLARRLFRKLFGALAAGERAHAELRARAHAKFAALRARRAPVSLVYSDGDDGLIELATWFGKDGRALAAFPNVRRWAIPDADHNLTPPAARARLLEVLKAAAIPQPE